jgi:hypothetical protein
LFKEFFGLVGTERLVFKNINLYRQKVPLNGKEITSWFSSFLSAVFFWDSPWDSLLWLSWPPGAIASNARRRRERL